MARHSWGGAERYALSTVRRCGRCGLAKVTRHEPGVRPWIEFVRDCERLQCEGTPPCEPLAGTALQHEIAATARRPDEAQA